MLPPAAALPALLALPVILAGPAPTAVVEARPGRVSIDWTAGRIRATGAGAPDLRAPGPEVARVAAERAARRDAARKLEDTARALPRASAARVAEAVTRARELDVSYASDGAAEVTLGLPLEAIRELAPAAPPPAADPAAPTAIVVDARKLGLAPALGVALVAGGARYVGPTVWHRAPGAARLDARLGDRPITAAATAADPGAAAITVDLDEATLARAAKAGALVVVLVGGKP